MRKQWIGRYDNGDSVYIAHNDMGNGKFLDGDSLDNHIASRIKSAQERRKKEFSSIELVK